jgi:hemerythrin-like metal-binding protein
VAWIPEFETGQPLLDGQHKDIVRYFNQLVAATEGPVEVAAKTYARLMEGLIAHCAAEEGLMAASAFTGSQAHKTAHLRLLNQVQDLGEQVRLGTLAFTPPFLDCLEDLLLTHMQLEDLELARHLRSRPEAGA